jgi:hypothetical protein
VARLKALSAGAKQRAEEGGEVSAAEVTEVLTQLAPDQEAAPPQPHLQLRRLRLHRQHQPTNQRAMLIAA